MMSRRAERAWNAALALACAFILSRATCEGNKRPIRPCGPLREVAIGHAMVVGCR